MSEEKQDAKPGSKTEPIDPANQADQERVQAYDSIGLGLRFLVGLLAIGGEQAARRLGEMQRKLDEDPSLWQSAGNLCD